jgi:hypothetical protein
MTDWTYDKYGQTWRWDSFTIERTVEGDSKWPPLVPPIVTYGLYLKHHDGRLTGMGQYRTLGEAKHAAEEWPYVIAKDDPDVHA